MPLRQSTKLHAKPTDARPVSPGYRLVPCPGSAHSADAGGMVDNCGLCAPRWGYVERLAPETIRELAEGKRHGGRATSRELARMMDLVLFALTAHGSDNVIGELRIFLKDYLAP